VNDARRKEITDAISKIEDAKSILDLLATEERSEYEELSEKAQESDKGIKIEAAATSLEESIDDCDNLISKLNDAKV
jgi:hypothetical protein